MSPSTSDWINGSVTVTATTTQTGYNLQTSTNGSDWGKTNPLTFTANGTAYARLWDGYNCGTAASTAVTNIDKTAPTISSFTAGTVTGTTIPVTVSASDSGSEIKSYAFYLGSELKTTQTSSSYTYKDLTSVTSYTLKVVVTDNAGNSNSTTTTASTQQFTEIEKAIAEGIQVGDTVTYTPPTASYTVKAANSGYSKDQTFDSSNSAMTTWKVWKINKTNNTIEIVSSDATATTLYLKGYYGFTNGPSTMNNICSTLYSNSRKGITARSLNRDDFESATDSRLGTKTCWLASQYKQSNGYVTGCFLWCLRGRGSEFVQMYIAGSNQGIMTWNFGLSPLASLDSSVQLVNTGTNTWTVQ